MANGRDKEGAAQVPTGLKGCAKIIFMPGKMLTRGLEDAKLRTVI
jgi:hypothetical protein